MNGYFGKILWVDLSSETFEEVKLPEKTYRQFIGGYGLGCRVLYDLMKPKVDPLSADSIFGFFPGLLTGTAAPLSGRYMACGKSPLTGTWGDANGGGTFGPAIKKCGYDGIIIMGIAENPKYIAIIDGKKEILDASEIWGLDIIETEDKMREKHGKFVKTAAIGKSGEKLSLISGIAHDKGRIAARSGLGAIMGSKKLKALVLKGNEKIQYHDKGTFLKLVKKYNKKGSEQDPGSSTTSILKAIARIGNVMRMTGISMEVAPSLLIRKIFHNLGTSVFNTISAEIGDSPIRNWNGIGHSDFPSDKTNAISTLEINKYKVRNYGCYSCPIQCGAVLSIPEIGIEETHIPEYETCCTFGGLLLNNDLMSIFKINEMCNRAAIDTISTGATIAFAIECFEHGILTAKDTDGLMITWGNSKSIIELVEKIINREGIGDILADGSKVAAEKIGNGSEQYVMASLGQELPMHDPKYVPSMAFSYAFDPKPGTHSAASIDFDYFTTMDKFQKGFKYPKNYKKQNAPRQKAQKMLTGYHQTFNSAGMCIFSYRFGRYPFLELINSLTGWDMTLEECIETGVRIQTLRQAFTLREGVEISKNRLPGRVVGDPPFEKGPHKDVTIDYKSFYLGYCYEMGWTVNGYPFEETLQELDLEFVKNDLDSVKI